MSEVDLQVQIKQFVKGRSLKREKLRDVNRLKVVEVPPQEVETSTAVPALKETCEVPHTRTQQLALAATEASPWTRYIQTKPNVTDVPQPGFRHTPESMLAIADGDVEIRDWLIALFRKFDLEVPVWVTSPTYVP